MADESDSRLEEALRELKEARSENRALRAELGNLDERLAAVERSIVFRGLRAVGLQGQLIQRKAGQALLRSGLHPLYAKLTGGRAERAYAEWLGRHCAGDPLRNVTTDGALLSVLLPTRSPRLVWLKAAVESVAAQTHKNWQLCVCIDGEISREAVEYLLGRAAEDPRIAVTRTEGAGISAALNRALAEARGEFVAFLDHDDVMEPTALAHVSLRLSGGGLDVVYTDEGYIDEQGAPVQPSFKPGWSPNLLLTCMYMGHLLVLRRESVAAAGGFRTEMNGAQDYDLVLRMVGLGARVGHIPRVLYHWRRHGGSTASSQEAKPYAQEAGRRALEDAMRRSGSTATVSNGERPNSFRLEAAAGPMDELVSIVIPTRSSALLTRCLESLRETTQAVRYEVVVVRHLNHDAEDARVEAVGAAQHARVVSYDGPFNFSKMCNEGAQAASGNVLVFLNDDVEPVTADWLRRLCGAVGRDGVGVAGARLMYPQGAIQHVGLVLGMSDGVGHLGRHLLASSYWPWIEFTRDVSAVTGACLAIRRALFETLGGFDAAFPVNYNDVDLCLRARAAGYQVVLENGAVLTHREAVTRQGGTSAEERLLFQQRWGHLLETVDEYFTPNLRLDIEDLSLTR